ncbi:hypothetical protein SPHINGOT1_140008 [Sphingomonas sp. T1]|nr:hypothetical protein SPHINGOT1_140008 [Sphingomonas sp. T1]
MAGTKRRLGLATFPNWTPASAGEVLYSWREASQRHLRATRPLFPNVNRR